METVFITGVSGLLGRAVSKIFGDKGFFVLGQYFLNKPPENKNSKRIYGDFSSIESLQRFLSNNSDDIINSSYFVNCYGPITYKPFESLKTEDYLRDYLANFIIPVEIIEFIVKSENHRLKSIINIGFELTGKIISVKNVLSYAVAKNALLQYSLSFTKKYPNIKINTVSPITIEGAKYPAKNKETIPAENVAKNIFKIITGEESGANVFIP